MNLCDIKTIKQTMEVEQSVLKMMLQLPLITVILRAILLQMETMFLIKMADLILLTIVVL